LRGLRNYALDSSFLIYRRYKGDGETNDILEATFLNLVALSEALYVICIKEGVTTALNFTKEISKVVGGVP